MSFLTPWTIAAAAGLTLPPLIALYFLKLKRTVRLVPSTLLWKRSVEDLQVNSPFQRLRSSLLLFLQLLVLLAGVFALGKPMLATAPTHEDALILLIDRSASMNVREADGRTRLETAKQQAKRCVEGLARGARAMVIAFADRPSVISSFDSDKEAVQRKIDEIEPTQCTSMIGEAMSLAETYAQTMIIAGEQVGTDVASGEEAPPAKVFLFTDGRIRDADRVALQKFDLEKIAVHKVGQRSDNVGILAMEARRNYERPEMLEVSATVANMSPDPRTVDAVLYIEGRNVDVQTLPLGPAPVEPQTSSLSGSPGPGAHTLVVAFDDIEFEGSGVVEVVLRVDDALPDDDRAWTVIDEPHRTRVLLVEGREGILSDYLAALAVDFQRMTGAEYESADDKTLLLGKRSAFDAVIFDRHSTARLPPGNYFFWGGVPQIDGVSAEDFVRDEVIFNWDDTHPVLRYVGVETLAVDRWLRLKLPVEAVPIVEGQTSPVLVHLVRGPSQILICAFSLIVENDAGEPVYNTAWRITADFIIFLQNAVNLLSGNLAATGRRSIEPGQTVTLPIPGDAPTVTVRRPDGTADELPVSGHQTLHYARTQRTGVYRVSPGVPGQDVFAVNLFDLVESRVAPADTLSIGSSRVQAQSGSLEVNRPAWTYFLVGLVVLLLLEWLVYNLRVLV